MLSSSSFPNSTVLGSSAYSYLGDRSIVFIDSRLNNIDALIRGIHAANIVVLDANRDGVEQITDTLSHYTNLNSVHILSHGSVGDLQLGNTELNAESFGRYEQSLSSWQSSLTATADILLYGCDVGSGAVGQSFIQHLSQVTTADVAASIDTTGNASLGGNWDLEVHTGSIEAVTLNLPNYAGILPTYNGKTYVLTNGTKSWTAAQAEAQSLGGNLVTINDSAEQSWLRTTFGQTERLWIGLTDRVTEGQFVWINGETATYRNWASGEPNNYTFNGALPGGEDYVVLNWNSSGQWNDMPDSYSGTFRGIIEIPGTPPSDTQAPTASLAATNLNTGGGTTYDFTVTYSDDVAVNVGSIDGNDIRVTGPNSFSQLASLVSVNNTANGTPRTATYRITAPGGNWDSSDNGTYSIALQANQVTDTSGKAVAASTLGAFQVGISTSDTTPPTASLTANLITTLGGTTYDFTVVYSDNVAVNVSSINSNDILVTGPNGFSQFATLVSVNNTANGTPRTATYRINAPGGSWDITDNGTYSFALQANQVTDTTGNAATAVILGTKSLFPTYNGKTYLFTNGTKSWTAAQTEAQTIGGNLVTVNDSAEQSWLRTTFGQTERLWIGLTDRVTEGQFVWVNGETATYRNWASGEPNNYTFNGALPGGEDYAVLNWNSSGQWNDMPDSYSGTFRGIIEIPSIPPSDTQAPTASLSLLSNLLTTAGGTTYDFTVTYSDDVAVNVGSIDGNDIRVTGPGGFSQLASLVSVNNTSNGTPRTATYRITAPGGTWDSTDNGTYSFALQTGQVTDTSGKGTVSNTTFNTALQVNIPVSDTQAPTASLSLLSNPLTTAGGTTYDFTVTYSDDVAVNVGSIDGNDILVSGIKTGTSTVFFSQLASLVSVNNTVNGTPRTATYRFTAPGGTWDSTDNGTYSFALQTGQVTDTSGKGTVSNTTFNTALQVNIAGTVSDIPFTRLVIDPLSPSDPWAKQMGDLDRDGYLDMVVAGEGSSVVWYRYDPGTTTFTKYLLNPVSSTQSGSALVDLDSNGYLDLIVGNSWYENPLGTGGKVTDVWVKHDSFTTGVGDHDVRTGDLDGDGKVDVVIRSENSSVVDIYYQNTPTSFTRVRVNPGFGTNGLELMDIDGDGKLDVITPGRWLKNPGTRTGTWQTYTFGTWASNASITFGDINGDGRLDILMSDSEGTNGKLSWFEHPVDPTKAWTEHVVDQNLTKAHAVFFRDMDLDGQMDIVTSEYDGAGRLIIYRNGGAGASWTRQILGTPALHNIAVGDYDQDGDIDIMGVQAFGQNPVEVWRNDVR